MKEQPKPMSPTLAVAAILQMFVANPLRAFVGAVGATWLWNSFLAPEYGPGPSMRAWFGIQFLIGLATFWIRKDAMFETDDDRPLASLVVTTVLFILAIVTTCSVARLVVLLGGWS